MAIYTKTGDKGTTSLFDGKRVSKTSTRVQAYGTLDELNAHLSMCEKLAVDPHNRHVLYQLQHILFRLCAEVATDDIQSLQARSEMIQDSDVRELEHIIDNYTKELPPVHSFILSGKYTSSAALHIARTVCRRAERWLIALQGEEVLRPVVVQFINRLSDCLYMLARKEDYVQFVTDAVKRVSERLQGVTTSSVASPASLWDQADSLVQAARRKAEEIGVPMVIAIVDDKGRLITQYCMKDALLVSHELAPKKAYTAVALKCDTHTLQEAVQPGAPLFQIESMVSSHIVTFGGGFVIYNHGQLIGGIGISGGTVEEDMYIGRAALDAVYT